MPDCPKCRSANIEPRKGQGEFNYWCFSCNRLIKVSKIKKFSGSPTVRTENRLGMVQPISPGTPGIPSGTHAIFNANGDAVPLSQGIVKPPKEGDLVTYTTSTTATSTTATSTTATSTTATSTTATSTTVSTVEPVPAWSKNAIESAIKNSSAPTVFQKPADFQYVIIASQEPKKDLKGEILGHLKELRNEGLKAVTRLPPKHQGARTVCFMWPQGCTAWNGYDPLKMNGEQNTPAETIKKKLWKDKGLDTDKMTICAEDVFLYRHYVAKKKTTGVLYSLTFSDASGGQWIPACGYGAPGEETKCKKLLIHYGITDLFDAVKEKEKLGLNKA